MWLDDGASIHDRFGKWLTLVRFGSPDADTSAFEEASAAQNVPLDVIDIAEPAARDLYQCAFAVIRPDHHVAWRADTLPADPAALIRQITGNAL